MSVLLVRVTGLEPVRHKHTPLKRACLPVPAHSLTKIDYNTLFCSCQEFFEKICIYYKENMTVFVFDIFEENLTFLALYNIILLVNLKELYFNEYIPDFK